MMHVKIIQAGTVAGPTTVEDNSRRGARPYEGQQCRHFVGSATALTCEA